MIEGSRGDDDVVVIGGQARSVSIDQEQGIKVLEETNRTRLEKVELPFVKGSSQNWGADFIAEKYDTFPVMEKNHNHKNMKVESQETSSPEEETDTGTEGRIDKLKQVAVIDEGEVVVNVNLERILEEQDTHDLYCPNCHSCITKRVILHKRKRTTGEDTSDAKCVKTGPAQLDCILSTSVIENKDEGHNSEPEVFRCLSCFSYFIPTDNGFRLFKIFGKREGNDSIQGPEEVLERSQNWLFSLYDFMMGKRKESELGLASCTDKGENKVSSLNLPGQTEKHLPGGLKISPELCGETRAIGANIRREVEKAEQDPKMCIQTPPKTETLVFEKEENGKAENIYLSEVGKEDQIMPATEGMGKNVKGTFSAGPSRSDLSLFTREVDQPIHSETRILLGEPTTEEARQTPQGDILKAIVYGGLLESIVALGVISAAAGCDMSTVNVVALGLANLVGGLPTLIHNLFELRNETPSRYEELLGKKGRFWVHFTVASLCFVLLGASPPVIYGFSFRQSDDRELKMATVAGASLICVALLAVAKAHAQEGRKKPHLQMLLRYVGLAAGGSGLSYVVGTAVKKLMEKLALFDGWAANLASPFSSGLENATSTAPSWGAY